MVYAYARVSTENQCLDRQIDALKNYGYDKIYCEKMSGTRKNRPELDSLLDNLQRGDTVVVESLSRLGRSVKNLSELMEWFNEIDVRLVSLKETIDTHSSAGKLLFTILSSLAQFERDVIAERTIEGLNAARARGRLGGRPKVDENTVNKKQLEVAFKKAKNMLKNGTLHNKKAIVEKYINKITIYRNKVVIDINITDNFRMKESSVR